MKLPQFKYHPFPLKTGAIETSENECECCGKQTGYIYTGPVYSEEELDDCICPWCIADGSASKKFDAEFTDPDGIGDYGSWDSVSEDVVLEVSTRTPGFCGWQQERWWTHCHDAGEFLGAAGTSQVLEIGGELIDALKADTRLEGAEWDNFCSSLSQDGSPTAYIFRCTKCGVYGGYVDCD